MKRSLPVVLALCLVAAAAVPLAASEPILTVGTATRSNVSEPIRELLRDLPQAPQTGLASEVPIQIRPDQLDRVDPGTGSSRVQTGPGDTLTPAVGLSFEGLSDDDNADIVGIRIVPPDTNGDIGFDDQGNAIYIQWINLIVAVYDANNGSLLAGPFPGNVFWAGFTGSSCETQNDGDPVVLYDDDAGRWAMSQFDVGAGLMCWAISQTSDPLGAYNQYEFQIASAAGGNPDYPKAGVWAQAGAGAEGANESAYTQTTRNFPFNPGSFMQLVTLERDVMLAGGAAPQFRQFGFSCVTGDCLEGALPPHQAGPPPPAGTCPTFFTLVDDAFDDSPHGADGVRLHQICSDWTGGSPTITETFAPSSVDFSRFLGNGFSDCITPVPAGGEALDCLAIFTMFRAQYRWFGDEASVVLNTTVDATATDIAGIYWAELRSADGQTGWSVHQDNVFAPDDGADRWMGSIAQDGDRNIALGYSITRAGGAGDILPSVWYTARQVGDPAGTMGNEEICHTGTGVQTGSANRWGDYSSMSVDPRDDCTFWYTQEYYETTGSFDFTSRVCSFAFEDCGQGCVLTASTRRQLRRGEKLPIDLSITHNRPAAVQVPFVLEVRDRRGNLVASDRTEAFSLQFGQTLEAGHSMQLPDLVPGTYRLTVSMDEMRGGTEVTSVKFRVR